jgi:hypothetical protein
MDVRYPPNTLRIFSKSFVIMVVLGSPPLKLGNSDLQVKRSEFL